MLRKVVNGVWSLVKELGRDMLNFTQILYFLNMISAKHSSAFLRSLSFLRATVLPKRERDGRIERGILELRLQER